MDQSIKKPRFSKENWTWEKEEYSLQDHKIIIHFIKKVCARRVQCDAMSAWCDDLLAELQGLQSLISCLL